jgi:hypothetical protein
MTYLIGDTESQTIGDAESLTVGPVLQVSGDLTVNNARKLDANASDTDSNQSSLKRIRGLSATASDSDSATASLDVVSTGLLLSATASDGDSATSATDRGRDLNAIASDTDKSNTNITRLREIVAAASDTDKATANSLRTRELEAIASDTDDSQTLLTRTRELDASASDSDAATVTEKRVRLLVAEADNSDSATTVFLPGSTSIDPRKTVIEILSSAGRWPGQTPIIKPVEQTTPKTRQNTTEPAIYVHKPVDDDLTRFSAESLALEEDETVELYIYILETDDETPPERAAREYRNRVINVLSGYMNDNYTRTEFLYLEPTGATDARASTIARQTDHYVYSVEVETHRLAQQL